MARPRTQDPVVSTTICLPTSVLQRLQTLSDSRVARGFPAKSVSKLLHEMTLAALPAYEASEGYLWNPLANRSAVPAPLGRPLPSEHCLPLPGVAQAPSTFPLPPPPPQAPTYAPTDAPPLRDLLAAAQEQRLGTHQDLSLDTFFAELGPQDTPPPGRAP